MSENNPNEKYLNTYRRKRIDKYDFTPYLISVRYNLEIIYEKGITCTRMRDLRIYDTFIHQYLNITKDQICKSLETLINKSKE